MAAIVFKLFNTYDFSISSAVLGMPKAVGANTSKTAKSWRGGGPACCFQQAYYNTKIGKQPEGFLIGVVAASKVAFYHRRIALRGGTKSP
jgi:hypothetical protein